jgi:hypothetical protein
VERQLRRCKEEGGKKSGPGSEAINTHGVSPMVAAAASHNAFVRV